MDAELARRRGGADAETVDTGADGFAKAYGLTGKTAKKPEEKALLVGTSCEAYLGDNINLISACDGFLRANGRCYRGGW